MNRMLRRNLYKIWPVILVIITLGLIIGKINSINKKSVRPISPESGVTPVPTDNAYPSPTPETLKVTYYQNSELARKRLVCSYLAAADRNLPGAAKLDIVLDNLVAGKNGRIQAAVCIGKNGGEPALVTTVTNKEEHQSLQVPSISLDTHYDFILVDQHGGDLPGCSGNILAACSLSPD